MPGIGFPADRHEGQRCSGYGSRCSIRALDFLTGLLGMDPDAPVHRAYVAGFAILALVAVALVMPLPS